MGILLVNLGSLEIEIGSSWMCSAIVASILELIRCLP